MGGRCKPGAHDLTHDARASQVDIQVILDVAERHRHHGAFRAVPDPRRGSTMASADIAQLINDLQTAVTNNPAAAAQKVADLKAKYAMMPPDQQEQVKKAIGELGAKAGTLPPELQQQLRDIATTIDAAS
jgi:hypothetical protein